MTVASLSPPLSLSKYEVLEEIGHGGMATVYRARDTRLGREVALKVIHRHLRENVEVARRFASEALAVAKVKHPNIVEVYDVSADDEPERYLVVELIQGQTLRQLLSEGAPLPPEVAAAIAIEVCAGLAHAHSQGVVHRDVKPENVLLRLDARGVAETRVKLTDFGIAKLLDAQGVTHTGQVLGSPAHMAPEQIEGGEVDARSDVFGVGVLLYEMMTGSLPFDGKNPAQVLRRVLEGSFIPADRVNPLVGNVFSQIVGRALAREPKGRFESATALGLALREELSSLGVTDPALEIADFLDRRQDYLAAHPFRIVEALSTRAQRRRQVGDITGSSGDFNRALAYRPDDTLLLSEVAGLARRRKTARQMRLLLKFFGGAAILAGVIGVLVTLLSTGASRPRSAERRAPDAPSPSSSSKTPPKVVEVPVRSPSAAEPVRPSEPALDPTKIQPGTSPNSKKGLVKPSRAAPEGTRQVRTPVVGPQNARVRIDGQLAPWFRVHELPYGVHTFEFVPPNAECCEEPPPVHVEIVPGEGSQLVRGTIAFRDAILRFDAPEGARASCGVGGVLAAGTSRRIPMNRPEQHLSCTVIPPPTERREPRSIDVDLRPGRIFTLSGN